jgi:hypothetical protein
MGSTYYMVPEILDYEHEKCPVILKDTKNAQVCTMQSYTNVRYLLYCTVWYRTLFPSVLALLPQELPFHTYRPLLHVAIHIDHTFASRHSH